MDSLIDPSEKEARIAFYKKLLEAQKEMKIAFKDKRNQFHESDYTSSEDFIFNGCNATNKHGIIVYRNHYEIEGGTEKNSSNVKCYYTIAEVEKGYTISIDGQTPIVENNKNSKADSVAAALTKNMGNIYRDLLGVSKQTYEEIRSKIDRNLISTTKNPIALANAEIKQLENIDHKSRNDKYIAVPENEYREASN